MSIREQEEALFRDWEEPHRHCNPFVRDGVVNEAAYKASKCKVAFVLKEYWHGDSPYDLREEELICPFGPWKKVAAVLRDINLWRNPGANNDGAPEKMPDNICAFNLKKKRGGRGAGDSNTDWAELREVALRDKNLIRKQFNIYDPDLTFCLGYNAQQGNMLDIFRDVMGHTNKQKDHTEVGNGWGWYERCHGKVVVNTYHMSSRRPDASMDPEEVVAAAKEIYEKVRFGR